MSNNNNKSHGVVIQFPDHMTREQCDDILKRMMKAGYCKPAWNGEAPTAHEFDPEFGGPVWYIP